MIGDKDSALRIMYHAKTIYMNASIKLYRRRTYLYLCLLSLWNFVCITFSLIRNDLIGIMDLMHRPKHELNSTSILVVQRPNNVNPDYITNNSMIIIVSRVCCIKQYHAEAAMVDR